MPQFDDVQDWVTGYETNWLKMFSPLINKPVQMIEIGSWEGRSLTWWVTKILTHEDSRITSIDPHLNQTRYSRFLSNISEIDGAHKITPIRARSHKVLPNMPDSRYDIIYVDGSHEGRDVMIDACFAIQKVKVGGIVLFDDYEWKGDPDYPRLVLPGPAIDTFLELHSDSVEVIYRGYQLAVRRTA